MIDRVSWNIPEFDTDWVQLFGYVNIGNRRIRIYIFESYMSGSFYVEVDEFITSNVLDKRLFRQLCNDGGLYGAMKYAQEWVRNNLQAEELCNAQHA